MTRKLLVGLCLAVVMGTAGCQDQKPEPTAPAAGTGPEFARRATQPKVDRNHIKLPASLRIRDHQLGTVARRVINPDDFVCPPTTPLIDFLIETIDESEATEPAIFNTLIGLAADVVPTIDAIFFETEATPQFFGYTGEYTHRLTKTERDLKRFWDIASANIQLVGMHGTMLLDVDRVARVYETPFFTIDGQPIPHDLALQLAGIVRNALLASVTMDGGNWPLFSFNAFAIAGDASIPDKIVMGDGVMESYKEIGFDDVAPEAVYAHEFGHHVQFQKGYFDDPLATTGDPAERTRYTELMADAFGAFYLTHKRGAALNRKRVAQFLEVYFNVGDCAFDDPGHHGTPNQRMRAANFAFNLADQAQKQGHLLTADEFHAQFVAAYPGLIAPDAT
ncbi:MAG: hypothetical protein ACREM9_06850 [Gemmatimonadales bacterium]